MGLTYIPMETKTHFSEAILIEILARLPLRSISRYKSVCKTWKSTLESPYFRRLFASLHKNSSSSWSLLSLNEPEELIGFYGCKTWNLPMSLASFIPRSFKHDAPLYKGKLKLVTFSNGLVLIKEVVSSCCYVGNTVLQQWVKIPPPPRYSIMFRLVTRVDEDGVVLSFKVVSLASLQKSNDDDTSRVLSFFLYSSETGIWTSKIIHCPYKIFTLHFMSLNGMIYQTALSESGVFVAHDFYSDSENQFRVVHYLDHLSDNIPEFRRALTTSGGFVMCVRTLAKEEETIFNVWRLNNDDDSWQLLWEIGIPVIGNYVTMAMHPFNSDIVYLWSLRNFHLVTCNLSTRRCKIVRDGFNDDDQDCFINHSVCDKYMDEIWGSRSSFSNYGASFSVLQFVVPGWMESVPCPPHVEMIDTISLLSNITSED